MKRHGDRRVVVEDTRHAWFIAFEREFRQQVGGTDAAFNPAWSVKASEADWRVWMHTPGAHARTVSIDLPPDYSLFQPLAVASNTVLRLRGAADAPGDASGTSAAAGPRRS